MLVWGTTSASGLLSTRAVELGGTSLHEESLTHLRRPGEPRHVFQERAARHARINARVRQVRGTSVSERSSFEAERSGRDPTDRIPLRSSDADSIG